MVRGGCSEGNYSTFCYTLVCYTTYYSVGMRFWFRKEALRHCAFQFPIPTSTLFLPRSAKRSKEAFWPRRPRDPSDRMPLSSWAPL